MNPIIFLLIDMLNFLEDIFFIWFVTYCALLVGNVLVCGPCCTYQFSILIYDIYALLYWKLIELVCSIWWNFIKVEGLMRILDSPSENLSKFEIVLISLLQHFVNVFVFCWSFQAKWYPWFFRVFVLEVMPWGKVCNEFCEVRCDNNFSLASCDEITHNFLLLYVMKSLGGLFI